MLNLLMMGCDFVGISNRFAVGLVLCLLLSGCISSEPILEQRENAMDEPPTAEVQGVPEWTASSHNGTQFNRTMMSQRVYIAYFSAPWCSHCEATLDTYDQVIPNGQMMVFSQDDDPEFSNMSAWHETTESNLNRSIERPFMLMPEFATEMGVMSIPHVAFVNEQGYIFQTEIGKRTNQTMIGEIWNATLTSTYDATTGWS